MDGVAHRSARSFFPLLVLTCLLRLSDFYKNEMNAGHVSNDSDRKTAEGI